ncbi:UNVERIFIED_ORG: hypothetical protein HNP28_000105 [Comamonas terrigena]
MDKLLISGFEAFSYAQPSEMDAWILGSFAYNRPSNQSQLPEIVGSGRVA